MTDSIRDQSGEWYVTTRRAKDGGVRLAGPFSTLNDGITARSVLEDERGTCTFWVLDASDEDCPPASPEGSQ